MDPVLDFIEKNEKHFLEGLKELLRIESISTQPAKREDVLRCADLELKKFKEVGLENVKLLQTTGYPLVYGDWLHAKGKPTVLVYGHYDVQPPDPLEEWVSPPFEPTERNGNLYGRGTSDNKGQHFVYLCAIEAFLKTVGRLPINVKVVLEGEEENGSPGIMKYVPENEKFLACDAVLISDGPWHDFEHPTIAYSLKGLMYFQILVKGPSHDLHSGLFGGVVRNPIQVLSWILAKLKDENEKIVVPDFYEDVTPLSIKEKNEIAAISFDEKELLKETGSPQLVSERGYTPFETNARRPTLDVCGIWGGYQAVGAKTIIPAEAGAKVSIRLVAKQKPDKIAKQFTDYVKSLCPKGVTLEVKVAKESPALMVDRDNFYLQQTAKAFEKAFDQEIIFKGEGASIPVATTFQEVLKTPVVLAGLGLPDDRLHSPNEKISLRNFLGGMKAAVLTFQALGEKRGGAGGI